MVAVPVRIVDGARGDDLLGASLSLAHTQLVGQLADETSLDARTMGTLGFAGALLAADLAAKDLLGAAWWALLIAIAAAAACCLRPALALGFDGAHDTDLGPDPAGFHAAFAGRPPREACEQLLADLGSAYSRNVRRCHAKQRALRGALVALMLGVLASAAVFSIDHHPTIGSPHEQRQAHI
ncbi:MAG TPA: hypothetical protein VN635_00880 [Conexibacter sp.]|nr:hypothetical protein [Conexibacter sp.]